MRSNLRWTLATIKRHIASNAVNRPMDNFEQTMLEPCKRCFYTIMANYNGSLKAVDCHVHSVRYDMAVNRDSCGRLRCLIRTPTTL
eukprot:scaffold7782_cov84-Skeletonema_marinoi.AAC.1